SSTIRAANDQERRVVVLSSPQPLKTVGAPGFAAHAMVDEEQAGRIVSLFHGEEPRVVRPPIGVLPPSLEEIAFGKIAAAARGDRLQYCHGPSDFAGGFPGGAEIWFVAGDSRIGGGPFAPEDREPKGVEPLGVHRRIARQRERLG